MGDTMTRLNGRLLFQAVAIAALIGLLAVGTLWFLTFRDVPFQKARLFENPISNIQSIQVQPVQFRSLLDRDIMVTNGSKIEEIMSARRSAKPYSPSHPVPRWHCDLVISDSRGNSYVELVKILADSPQGTIIFCKTSKWGLVYKTLKSDTIGDTLEKAIAEENRPR